MEFSEGEGQNARIIPRVRSTAKISLVVSVDFSVLFHTLLFLRLAIEKFRKYRRHVIRKLRAKRQNVSSCARYFVAIRVRDAPAVPLANNGARREKSIASLHS